MPFRRLASPQLADLAILQREINQLFERLAEFDRANRPHGALWLPPTDVFDCRGNVVVTVEVPGIAPESLRVIVREGMLVITGERRERKPSGVVGFHCLERPHGQFSREIPLGPALDIHGALARLARGVLTISIPRLKDRRGRETTIPVERVD
jgi:HSP20 family protein